MLIYVVLVVDDVVVVVFVKVLFDKLGFVGVVEEKDILFGV